MTSTLTVRLAAPPDIPAIQQLAHAVYTTGIADEVGRQRRLERLYNPASLSHSIANEATALYLAHTDHEVVGLTHFGSPLLEECANRKEIHRLLVHPAYTRRGTGGQLLQAMVAHHQHQPLVRQFFVYVPAADEARAAFYRRYGFQRLSSQDRDEDRYYYFNVL